MVHCPSDSNFFDDLFDRHRSRGCLVLPTAWSEPGEPGTDHALKIRMLLPTPEPLRWALFIELAARSARAA